MTNGFEQRVIELLEEDIAQADKVAQAWAELAKDHVLLEDLHGNVFGTAKQMADKLAERAKELRAVLADIRG